MKRSLRLPALILFCALLFWWLRLHRRIESKSTPSAAPIFISVPPKLVPFRTAGGTLHTNGFTKTEILQKETGSWFGTTSSNIRLNATYRYDIELRSKDWNIFIDDTRHVAFVIAPGIHPQIPVSVDSRSVEEWTTSGWGRFDKWNQLQALRKETSPYLERQSQSIGYIEVARGQARITVEEFAADWLLKSRGWPEHSERFVKVYFADEPDIPFPEHQSLKDFLP